MSNLSVFAFEGKEVRFVGTAEKPEWVASDVCSCLQIRMSGVSEALASLEDEIWSSGIVTGVTLKHSDSGIGITITVQNTVNDLSLVINTGSIHFWKKHSIKQQVIH